MLVEFRVNRFKNFKEQLVLKLDQVKNYEFSLDAIKDNVVKTGLVYGENGSGKTNLGLAIFDITLHLTDKYKNPSRYKQYLNLETRQNAEFYYRFKFGSSSLEYLYEKSDAEKLIKEKLLINQKEVIVFDHTQNIGFVTLEGTETLNKDLNEKNISFIKYIGNNTVLPKTEENQILEQFLEFVNRMLLFSSLERNEFQGFRNGSESISKEIIENGKLKDFEAFLSSAGLHYKLQAREVDGEKIMVCNFNGKMVNFYSVASKGTTSLALLFYWLMQFENLSFVIIDEFDAFYHHSLARHVVRAILNTNVQAIMTTHNTSIMDNELLRPDCYFNLVNGNINSLAFLTDKDIRKAHNLEKMYRADSFQ